MKRILTNSIASLDPDEQSYKNNLENTDSKKNNEAIWGLAEKLGFKDIKWTASTSYQAKLLQKAQEAILSSRKENQLIEKKSLEKTIVDMEEGEDKNALNIKLRELNIALGLAENDNQELYGKKRVLEKSISETSELKEVNKLRRKLEIINEALGLPKGDISDPTIIAAREQSRLAAQSPIGKIKTINTDLDAILRSILSIKTQAENKSARNLSAEGRNQLRIEAGVELEKIAPIKAEIQKLKALVLAKKKEELIKEDKLMLWKITDGEKKCLEVEIVYADVEIQVLKLFLNKDDIETFRTIQSQIQSKTAALKKLNEKLEIFNGKGKKVGSVDVAKDVYIKSGGVETDKKYYSDSREAFFKIKYEKYKLKYLSLKTLYSGLI